MLHGNEHHRSTRGEIRMWESFSAKRLLGFLIIALLRGGEGRFGRHCENKTKTHNASEHTEWRGAAGG